eukprot:6237300-Pyramimonas_sp.AAC.1
MHFLRSRTNTGRSSPAAAGLGTATGGSSRLPVSWTFTLKYRQGGVLTPTTNSEHAWEVGVSRPLGCRSVSEMKTLMPLLITNSSHKQ